ncbi:MBL fold metallo-hydrolase [Luteolibacter sp. AS25]|uniref:MBL fold metallo-hydrolase n=1 Tax=Luteolibacter sp. AS25 TaxID=3135776 RepID=UPI00398AA7F6
MNLEDEFPDVIRKAMMGQNIEASELAEKAGIEICEVSGLLHGDMEEQSARHVAEVLNLDPESLIALSDYQPDDIAVSGVQRKILPFGQWDVNAWLLEKNGTRLLFDTGFGAEDILSLIDPEGLDAVLITHADRDHTGGAGALKKLGVRVISEVEALASGGFTFGEISIKTVDLAGHKSPAAGYFVQGFDRQLFVPGDAIFAGSMGKCDSQDSYELALHTLGKAISLAEDTCAILPGHGPATTVREELRSNPFRLGFR